MNLPPTTEDLLARLRAGEDHYVERKSLGDWKKDALKTAVAFANSIPLSLIGVLFIGVRNDGIGEGMSDQDVDSIQKKLNQELDNAFPFIPRECRILEHGGKRLLAVLIPGSPDRPHFAGHSYVRIGSETRDASEAQFEALVAERSSKVRHIRKYIGQVVTLTDSTRLNEAARIQATTYTGHLADCNSHFLTIEIVSKTLRSFPVTLVHISHNNQRNSLHLEIR
jgi:hypothetical protein